MKKLVFVCLGNICRSPMAEFVMKEKLAEAGLAADYEVVSRATSHWEHGNPVHAGTQKVLREHGVKFDGGKSSQAMMAADFAEAELIFAMDKSNLTDLREAASNLTLSENLPASNLTDKIHLFLEEKSVPDPYYTGDFEETFTLVNQGCQRIIERFLK